MKAKIYPLEKINNEVTIFPSTFASHLAIICASLAVGKSVLKNVASSSDIDVTISWCKQIGATIYKKKDALIVIGFSNKDNEEKEKRIININNPIFECGESSITAKLMIPLLSTFAQPVGIKANKKIIQELHPFLEKLENNSVTYIEFENLIRIEKRITTFKEDLQGKEDVYMAAGFLLAFPFIRGKNSICLHAPVNNFDDYFAISKLMRKFKIEVKHPSSMVFEIEGYQKYNSCVYTIENDPLNICFMALLLNKFKGDKRSKNKIKLLNYNNSFTFDIHKILDIYKKNLFILSKGKIKLKNQFLNKIDISTTNYIIPFLYIYGTINQNDTLLYNIKIDNKETIEVVKLMNGIFTKLELPYSFIANDVVIKHGSVNIKKQVETNKNPYVVMALSYLALLSNSPIIIKDAQAVYSINDKFFEQIKELGGKVELIHN